MLQEFSEKQRQIAAWAMGGTEDGIICDGSVRSGKTVAMAYDFLVWSQVNFTGCNFIIAGQSVSAAVRNIVNPMKQMLREDLGFPFSHNRQDGTLKVAENTYYIFGGHDERSQDAVQGMTAAGMLLDECSLMPRSFIEQCIARCSVTGAKYWYNCNPGSPKNYVKAELIDKAEEKNLKYLHFTMKDNPALSDEYRERVARMYSGLFYDRYIRGIWTLAEGLVYGEWADGRLIDETAKATAQDVCYVSIDYGISNPFVALLWTVKDGVAYACDEYSWDGRKSGRLTDTEHYENMRQMIGNRYVERIVVDPSATSFIEEVLRRGEFDVQPADNRVLDGISAVSTAMGNGCLRISPRCKTLVDELGMYRWNDKAVNDAVIKESDHACDALRYFISTIGRGLMACF